jgi:hypothetical protein
MLPVVTQVPYHRVNSVGNSQSAPPKPKWQQYYRLAESIAGDFLQIWEFRADE